MAQCKYCGVDDLVWKGGSSYLEGWKLFDGDEPHNCKADDRKKLLEQRQKEAQENAEAIRKHKEANGYL